MTQPEKPNREKLRRLMGAYDITPEEAGALINKSAATISQYRSISGAPISDHDLDLLCSKLRSLYD